MTITQGCGADGGGGGSADLKTELDYDGSGNVIYCGKALPGSLTTDPVWQIRRLDYSANNVIDVLFAGGTSAFSSAWTDRLILSYS